MSFPVQNPILHQPAERLLWRSAAFLVREKRLGLRLQSLGASRSDGMNSRRSERGRLIKAEPILLRDCSCYFHDATSDRLEYRYFGVGL